MNKVTPLSAWLTALVLLGGLIALTHGTGERYRHERSMAFHDYQQARLAEYLQDPAYQPHVVTLGNSLLRAATPFEVLPDAQQTRWLRIFRPSDDFEPFAKLWPALLASPPDVLIIHTGLLLPETEASLKDRTRGAHILNDLHDWKKVRKTWRETKDERMQRYRAEVDEGQSRAHCLFFSDWEDARDFMAPDQPRYRQTPPITDQARHYVEQAAERIPEVILLDVPRSQSAEALFGNEKNIWLDALRDTFKDTPNITLIRLGEPLDDACYCDYRHLKPECRPQMEPALRNLSTAFGNANGH